VTFEQKRSSWKGRGREEGNMAGCRMSGRVEVAMMGMKDAIMELDRLYKESFRLMTEGYGMLCFP